MTVRYELQVHSRDVLTSSEYDKHTGYDLIKYVDDMPIQIQSIDLYNHNGQIKYDIRTQVVAQDLYESTGEIVGSFMFYDGTPVAVTAEWLAEMQYCASKPLLINDSAIQAFQKIKLNATILNLYSDSLTYDILKRNCNTSTQYFSDLYLNGLDVFSDLPGHYQGKDSNFNDYILDDGQPVGLTNYYIDMSSSLAEAIYSGMPEGFDMNNINIEKLENGELFISDGTQGYETRYYPTDTSIYNEKDGMFIVSSHISTSISNTADRCIIYCGGGNDTISVTGNSNRIFGSGGNDTITVKGNFNQITGGSSTDNIQVEGDNNIILWSPGNGMDTISSKGQNKIKFGGGITADNIKIYTLWHDNIQVVINDNPALGFVINGFLSESGHISEFLFSDGSSLDLTNTGAIFTPDTLSGQRASSYNDVLLGDDADNYMCAMSGNDILSGGKGNDDLFGDEGDDTYIWNLGDGLDTIQDSWGKSIIQFGEGISPADVTIRSNDGAVELLVNNDVTQGIRISTRYDLQRDESPYEVHFKDGTIMNLTNVGLTFTQTDEAEKITGTDFDDIIYANGGNDTVHAGSGNDIIYGGDGNDNLYGEEGSDIIHGGAGDDYIISDLDNAKDENWTHELYGDEGNDYLQGSIGKDILVGGTGNDNLSGNTGDDTYIYNLGDGFDTIYEDGGNDTITFGQGITLEDLTFRKSGTDLIININGDSSQGINIFNHALMRNDSLTEYNVESIRFADGSTLNISNADQLIQAMNSFSVSNSASTDTLSNPTEDVCDMYSLAASQDLTRKAI